MQERAHEEFMGKPYYVPIAGEFVQLNVVDTHYSPPSASVR